MIRASAGIVACMITVAVQVTDMGLLVFARAPIL
jgi:hypothetical protein